MPRQAHTFTTMYTQYSLLYRTSICWNATLVTEEIWAPGGREPAPPPPLRGACRVGLHAYASPLDDPFDPRRHMREPLPQHLCHLEQPLSRCLEGLGWGG